jgi:hypothetical protein
MNADALSVRRRRARLAASSLDGPHLVARRGGASPCLSQPPRATAPMTPPEITTHHGRTGSHTGATAPPPLARPMIGKPLSPESAVHVGSSPTLNMTLLLLELPPLRTPHHTCARHHGHAAHAMGRGLLLGSPCPTLSQASTTHTAHTGKRASPLPSPTCPRVQPTACGLGPGSSGTFSPITSLTAVWEACPFPSCGLCCTLTSGHALAPLKEPSLSLT